MKKRTFIVPKMPLVAEPDIGRDIATAIDGMLRALRILNRKETTGLHIAESLGIPEAIVERAFAEFQFGKSILTTRGKAKCGPMSKIIEIK